MAEKAPLRNLIDTLEEFAALHDTARRRAAAALGGDDGEGEGEGDAGANTSREDLPGIAASSDAIESQAHTRARADVNSQREGEYGLVTQIAVRLRELLEQEEELV